MLFIGESINATRKEVYRAIQNRDVGKIANLVQSQIDAGAHMLDINAGTGTGNEAEDLKWLVELVQSIVDISLCIDSSDPKAIYAAFKVHRGTPMLNSISAEKEKLDALLPLVSSEKCRVIALCVDDSGIPESVDGRLQVACFLVDKLYSAGVKKEDIYVDPAVFSVATNSKAAMISLDVCTSIKKRISEVNTLLALSNVGFGLPKRPLLNQVFASMAVEREVDAIIADVRDKGILSSIVTTNLLLGKDANCLSYIRAYRRNVLV